MKFFLINIFMAILWMFLWGAFDIYTLLTGMVIGYFLLGPLSSIVQHETYDGKLWRLLRFFVYFIRILVKANWDVAKVVIKPGFKEECRIIRYSVKSLNDLQITTLAHAITLTPGTLSLDISNDNQWLYVHCMLGQDRQAVTNDIDELRERILKDFL